MYWTSDAGNRRHSSREVFNIEINSVYIPWS